MSPTFSTPGQVDMTLGAWWQGDCAIGRRYFAYQIDPNLPVAPESQSWIAKNPGEFLVELDLPDGVMVILVALAGCLFVLASELLDD